MIKLNKLKISNRIKDHFIQAILIFASVLLAFYINKQSEIHKTENRKTIALKNIKAELKYNSIILNNWFRSHNQIKDKLNSIVAGKNDSLKMELMKYKYFNFGVLNSENLISDMLTNTAWETSKSSGIISEFDFETTQKLTFVYSQKDYTIVTLKKILNIYFSMESQKIENRDEVLRQLKLLFNELCSQEDYMKILYRDALTSIE